MKNGKGFASANPFFVGPLPSTLENRSDIVSGGFWYEALNWKRHFLREVEMIRGRYDDDSNLPLDVNADGWKDLVSCNYRSQSIYRVQNPGPSKGLPWTRKVVDKPGAMETGRLVDIDGDGRLDVLPNGVKFAAWWEVVAPKTRDEKPSRIRHNLRPSRARRFRSVEFRLTVSQLQAAQRAFLPIPNAKVS